MKKWIALVGVVLIAGVGVTAQAPTSMTLEQVNKAKADLATQEQLGALLNRAAGCEARMLDLPTLKARVAQLEALEHKSETTAPTAPVTPKD